MPCHFWKKLGRLLKKGMSLTIKELADALNTMPPGLPVYVGGWYCPHTGKLVEMPLASNNSQINILEDRLVITAEPMEFK